MKILRIDSESAGLVSNVDNFKPGRQPEAAPRKRPAGSGSLLSQFQRESGVLLFRASKPPCEQVLIHSGYHGDTDSAPWQGPGGLAGLWVEEVRRALAGIPVRLPVPAAAHSRHSTTAHTWTRRRRIARAKSGSHERCCARCERCGAGASLPLSLHAPQARQRSSTAAGAAGIGISGS